MEKMINITMPLDVFNKYYGGIKGGAITSTLGLIADADRVAIEDEKTITVIKDRDYSTPVVIDKETMEEIS